jgi:hypothetical protein
MSNPTQIIEDLARQLRVVSDALADSLALRAHYFEPGNVRPTDKHIPILELGAVVNLRREFPPGTKSDVGWTVVAYRRSRSGEWIGYELRRKIGEHGGLEAGLLSRAEAYDRVPRG